MAVPVQTPSKEYIANGTTTAFPLDFNCDKAEYLIVTLNGEDAPAGSWTLANDTVTFNVPPVNGVVVNLQRNTPFQRTTNYQLYDNSFRPSAVNKDFDLIWWKLQELGYRDQVIWLALVKEIADRIAGDEDLQNQINTIDEWLGNLQENVDQNTSDIAQLVNDLSKEIADRIKGDQILKDMFLSMIDEAINEGTINALAVTHIDSLEALEAIANVWDGRTVYVKDLGNYRYDALTTTWVKAYQDADNVKDGAETQKQINDKTIQKVSKLSDLRAVTPRGENQIIFVMEHTDNLTGGRLFRFNPLRIGEDDNATIVKGWELIEKNQLSVTNFGALTGVNSTTAFTAANNFASANGWKVSIPENSLFELDNSNIDTSNFIGLGKLKFINHNRVMAPEYRKGSNQNGIITLEDEFGQHVNANNRYSGFGCSALANGKEYVAVRCGQNHYYNALVPSHLVMYIIDRNKNNAVTKQVLMTSSVGKDIRDINISVMPQYANRLLIKFAMQTGSNTFDTYLLVYNCTNNTVERTRLIQLPTNHFTWGNTLITPAGFLLVPSYGVDGSCRIYLSNIVFDYTSTDAIAVTQAVQFESDGSAEPTICYYDDQLIVFYRMGTGVNGRYNKTYNLEGTSGWGANLSLPREVHAPYVDPYNFGKPELLMMCSLGNARSIIATFATQNLDYWYTTAQLYIAGDTTLASGQSGGYPSFVDYGENLSVQSYADFRSSDMTLMSRLDVRLTKKNMYSALNSYEAQRVTYENSSLDWGEYSLGTSAATIDIAIGLKRSLTVTKARLRMTGVSANTFAEILNSAGTVVATSALANINTSGYQDIEFTFPSTALTAGSYTIRIQRKDTANPLVFNWNSSNIVKKRVIKNKVIDILNLTSASSSTLWNNAGIHVDIL
ncbi:hypothetical protein MSC36_02475 [Acinetobacter baumannii]|uniref:hypothetical protein n=1 Tax=Acinetobacter baumannii TaxID=470 RepID=UPI00293FA30C|nr:hypothetical protein [Acinetobacter baumannii]MDV4244923.1 hypothetical protein [Acinetobacter baumannii]